jgi:hypothetical protein
MNLLVDLQKATAIDLGNVDFLSGSTIVICTVMVANLGASIEHLEHRPSACGVPPTQLGPELDCPIGEPDSTQTDAAISIRLLPIGIVNRLTPVP